jgi:hypothetical protein
MACTQYIHESRFAKKQSAERRKKSGYIKRGRGIAYEKAISLFVWLVADGWCWFVLREKYCWLVVDGWFVLREKYCWLVADKQGV